MIYIKRILFGLAWLLYRSFWLLLALPLLIVEIAIFLPIYYVKNGTICGYDDIAEYYGESIWEWINKFDPDGK